MICRNNSGEIEEEPDTIEKFFNDLGLTEEQIKDAFLKLVGTPENYDRLESLVTLKPDFKSFLPEVSKNFSVFYFFEV